MENIDNSKGAVIIMNHQSSLDLIGEIVSLSSLRSTFSPLHLCSTGDLVAADGEVDCYQQTRPVLSVAVRIGHMDVGHRLYRQAASATSAERHK